MAGAWAEAGWAEAGWADNGWADQPDDGGDVTAPELMSARINVAGTNITLRYSENVTGQTAFTLDASGGAVTMTGSSGDGTDTHVFTLSRTVDELETVTLDYDSGTGTSEDDASNALASIVDFPVVHLGASVPVAGMLIAIGVL